MNNFQQKGEVLTLVPDADVPSGGGHLFGDALFGIATGYVPADTAGEFLTEGVVVIAKPGNLAIKVGDRLYWNAATRVVNKTAAAQQHVAIAVEAATSASPTVAVKLTTSTALAA